MFDVSSDVGRLSPKTTPTCSGKIRNLIATNMKKVALSQGHGQHVLDLSGMHVLLQKSWMPPYHNKLKGLGTEEFFVSLSKGNRDI